MSETCWQKILQEFLRHKNCKTRTTWGTLILENFAIYNQQPINASIIHNYLWSLGQLFGFLETSIIYFLILFSIIGFLKPSKGWGWTNVFAFYFLLFGFLVWLVSIANILRWEYKMLWIVNWIIAAWAGEGIMRPLLWARSGLTAQAARPRQWPGLKSVQWQPPSVAESRVLLQRSYWV